MRVERMPLVFVTVGTDHHPFDRVVQWADAWFEAGGKERAQCLVQIGTSAEPAHVEWTRYLPFEAMEAAMREAAVVVSHGAGATATLAKRFGKSPIVVPRRRVFGEHVDDHQVRFARFAASQGEFEVAESEEELRALLDSELAQPSLPVTNGEGLQAAVARFEELVEGLYAPRSQLA
jgi:UDP-N-acetylglucosamine transferase subunit ALG13